MPPPGAGRRAAGGTRTTAPDARNDRLLAFTVAEHSFRVGVIGSVLAMMEGADASRFALMCLFHDSQETRIGDIPHIGRKYIRAAPNQEVTANQVANAPGALREVILSGFVR
ncbi:HD domain-containing protein [Streptomyces sp. KS 21]|nr:HD domain-containing protein [Streptomyces sp. KS 21]